MLVNGADHVIRGAGNIGIDVIDLDNTGVVTADVPGATLVLDLRYGGSTNTGLMLAENGGTLWFAHQTIDNTGGVIRALDGSFVDLGAPVVIGGKLATEGSGLVRVAGNTTTLRDLENTGLIRVLNDYDPPSRASSSTTARSSSPRPAGTRISWSARIR